jgi:hypothetical protein
LDLVVDISFNCGSILTWKSPLKKIILFRAKFWTVLGLWIVPVLGNVHFAELQNHNYFAKTFPFSWDQDPDKFDLLLYASRQTLIALATHLEKYKFWQMQTMAILLDPNECISSISILFISTVNFKGFIWKAWNKSVVSQSVKIKIMIE